MDIASLSISAFAEETSAIATESIFSSLGRVERYKGYWASSIAFMTYGYGNDWYARGCVSKIEPSGYTVDVRRFEPSDVFTSKEKAEAHGLYFLCNGVLFLA